MIKISVIVPCYNCVKSLNRCVNSLTDQVYKELEIVLVDDGSTDDTWEQIKQFSEKDKRIVALHKENGGTLSAREYGVNNSTGEFVMFCDSDDYYDHNLIVEIASKIDECNADMIAFGCTIHFPNGRIKIKADRLNPGLYSRNEIEKDILPNLYFDGSFGSPLISTSMWNKAFRKEIVLRAIKMIDKGIRLHEDVLVNFVALNFAQTLYSYNSIAGYNMVRNRLSKTGSFGSQYFDNLMSYFAERIRLADVMGYKELEQIYASTYCGFLTYIKKLIGRSDEGIHETVKKIAQMAKSAEFELCKKNTPISAFGLKEKVFAFLINHSFYHTAYFIVTIGKKVDSQGI